MFSSFPCTTRHCARPWELEWGGGGSCCWGTAVCSLTPERHMGQGSNSPTEHDWQSMLSSASPQHAESVMEGMLHATGGWGNEVVRKCPFYLLSCRLPGLQWVSSDLHQLLCWQKSEDTPGGKFRLGRGGWNSAMAIKIFPRTAPKLPLTWPCSQARWGPLRCKLSCGLPSAGTV